MLLASHDTAKQHRSSEGEPTKPVLMLVMTSTMLGLYLTYVLYHLWPMFQHGERRHAAPGFEDTTSRREAWIQLITFHTLTAMLLLCYARAIWADPGGIPQNDEYWEISERSKTPSFLKEWRGNGNRRSCKWCEKFKPDRSYHCRVCQRCVLKMDHHCRWINNCVGFGNYKFFFLLLLYTVLDLQFIVWTMAGSLERAFRERSHLAGMAALLVGEAVAFLLSGLVTLFFAFHVFLVAKGMSYIEFCEKTWPRCDASEASIEAPLYNLGLLRNIMAVFGSNPLVWMLPVSTPSGDGLAFPVYGVASVKDVEGGLGHGSKHGLVSYGTSGYGTWSFAMPPFLRARKA